MTPCCDKYVQHCQPVRPQKVEFFFEEHTCPSCGQKLRVQFQRLEFLGGEVEYVAISAEAIESVS